MEDQRAPRGLDVLAEALPSIDADQLADTLSLERGESQPGPATQVEHPVEARELAGGRLVPGGLAIGVELIERGKALRSVGRLLVSGILEDREAHGGKGLDLAECDHCVRMDRLGHLGPRGGDRCWAPRPFQNSSCPRKNAPKSCD